MKAHAFTDIPLEEEIIMAGISGSMPPAFQANVCKSGKSHLGRKEVMSDEGGVSEAIMHVVSAAVERCYEGVNLEGVTIKVSGNIDGNATQKGQRPIGVKVSVSGIDDQKAKSEVEGLIQRLFTSSIRFSGSATTFSGSASI